MSWLLFLVLLVVEGLGLGDGLGLGLGDGLGLGGGLWWDAFLWRFWASAIWCGSWCACDLQPGAAPGGPLPGCGAQRRRPPTRMRRPQTINVVMGRCAWRTIPNVYASVRQPETIYLCEDFGIFVCSLASAALVIYLFLVLFGVFAVWHSASSVHLLIILEANTRAATVSSGRHGLTGVQKVGRNFGKVEWPCVSLDRDMDVQSPCQNINSQVRCVFVVRVIT